jgi:hypothetical protein
MIFTLAQAFAIFAVAGAGIDGQQQQTQDHVWKSYINVRFQYSICYPPDLLRPQGEAPNSDGQKFTAKNGAQLIVYGRNNALNETLKEAMDETASRLSGKQGRVTYRAIKPSWFAVSGVNDNSTFYAKTLLSHNQFKSFELTYKKAAAPVYDPLVRRIAACFSDLAP